MSVSFDRRITAAMVAAHNAAHTDSVAVEGLNLRYQAAQFPYRTDLSGLSYAEHKVAGSTAMPLLVTPAQHGTGKGRGGASGSDCEVRYLNASGETAFVQGIEWKISKGPNFPSSLQIAKGTWRHLAGLRLACSTGTRIAFVAYHLDDSDQWYRLVLDLHTIIANHDPVPAMVWSDIKGAMVRDPAAKRSCLKITIAKQESGTTRHGDPDFKTYHKVTINTAAVIKAGYGAWEPCDRPRVTDAPVYPCRDDEREREIARLY